MIFRGQKQPGMPGYRHFDVDIASAELPCGASWIANVLLELGLPIFHPWGADTRAEWHCLGLRRFRYRRADEGWRRLLPGLRDQRVFEFRARPLPRVGHHWPRQYRPLPAILVVRDPRDALYSAWRRERKLGALPAEVPFIDFINAPFRHWPLSWAGYLALHAQSWLRQIERDGGLVLRFEDFKLQPLEEAQRVLDFLRIRIRPGQLELAAAASDHRQIEAAEAELLARGGVPSALLAGGTTEEWRTHFTADLHAALPQWIWPVFEAIGYQREHAGADLPRPGLEALAGLEEQLELKPGAPAGRMLAELLA